MRKKGSNPMQPNVLLKDSAKYSGTYVATRSFNHKTPICWGHDPVEVRKKAEEKGAKDPVVFYVPVKDMVHIY